MGFQVSQSRLRAIGLGVLFIFTYQNCQTGFQPVSSDALDHTLPANTIDPTGTGTTGNPSTQPVPPITQAAMISGTEFVPLELNLTPAQLYSTFTVDGLSEGMTYDATQHKLTWLPQRGQAGTYRIFVHTQSALSSKAPLTTKYIELQIAAMTDDFMHGGPPNHFHDGDVGYVFVHGAGGSQNRCVDHQDLANYWLNAPNVVAPDSVNRLVACYDGRAAVAASAPAVAQQILDASCGKFNRCIIITHSMGGLMMEHMFTHARPTRAGDLSPETYDPWMTYRQVRNKTLFVVSLGSAAGGSKTADIVGGKVSSANMNLLQQVIGGVEDVLGANDAATRDTQTYQATHVVAPVSENPGVPFFMVGGYSPRELRDVGGFENGIFGTIFGTKLPKDVFQTNDDLAMVNDLTRFASRSDGLVSFRSSCGGTIESDEDGPGVKATLDQQFQYCVNVPKKFNHYLWFLANINHFNLSTDYAGCSDAQFPCVFQFPTANFTGFAEDTTARGQNVMQVIRARLTSAANVSQALNLQINW